ncbi:MAG: sigma-70 family RNA polymerase sigma factor [Deltaproteobacteria bacterium]|jgi:RNA polymerase sigma-32 factor
MSAYESTSTLRALARANAPLTLERERALIARARTGDARARDELVRGHMRLVIATVRKLRHNADEDLIAEGVLGLLEALDRFDPSYEVRLATYAAPWIRVRAQRHVLTNRRIVGAPDTRAARKVLARIGRVERHLFATTGNASPEAIAKEIGVEAEDVVQVMVAMRSSDAPVGSQREEGGGMYEPPDASPSPEDALADRQERARVSSAVARALAVLPQRERAIVEARRLGEEQRHTLGEIAQSLRLSSERVRQLEIRALRQLGRELAHLAA